MLGKAATIRKSEKVVEKPPMKKYGFKSLANDDFDQDEDDVYYPFDEGWKCQIF